jgi:hypothetical protein
MLMALAAAGDDARGRALRRRAWAPEMERATLDDRGG